MDVSEEKGKEATTATRKEGREGGGDEADLS